MVADLNSRPARGLLGLAGLAAGVLFVHLGLVEFLAGHLEGLGATDAMPPRMVVRYLSEMELSAPTRRAAPATTRSLPSVAAAREAASAPRQEPAPQASEVRETVTPLPAEPASSAQDLAAMAQASAAAASEPASAPPFEWPVSTRMSYWLDGDYRGPVRGDAQVEWIRDGSRYQVHLDVSVGLLASRRMSSEGDITDEGLSPRRYDQETRLGFDQPYRATMRFEPQQVVLANGQSLPRGAGVQDTVSQFVQLSWLFATQPQRLQVGQVIEVPLAMPRSVSIWVYDVAGEETLHTTFGEVQAFHLKPRREPRAGGDMVVDIWIAPQLRFLPVRFRIRPDPEAHFDLMLNRRPELAAPAASPPSSSSNSRRP